jgi:putative tryptophan/tyrosine transport system substrate-binding protein
MRRREVIAGLTCTAAWPAVARAQPRSMPVVGLLGAASPNDAEVARNLAAFRQGLTDAGYVEGQNVRIEYRWAEGHYERLPKLAAELVGLNVDVIVNEGGRPWLQSAPHQQFPLFFIRALIRSPTASQRASRGPEAI